MPKLQPKTNNRSSLLLHICCAPCVAPVIENLLPNYNVTLYFFNPNIEPEEEYQRRLAECAKLVEKYQLKLIIGNYENSGWRKSVTGLEAEPEGGRRCSVCFEYRLRATAEIAKKENFTYFATTLSISPHKDSEQINLAGAKVAAEAKIAFWAADFKKDNGYLRSLELSRQMGFFRQRYCGCLYAKNNKIA